MNDLTVPEVPGKPGRSSLAEQLFPGSSETAGLIRATDWSRTPLGPVETWPQSLRTAVSICLGSRHPIVLWWGPERWMFYNDGYRPMLGEHKHPQFLGGSGQACWAEIWDIIGPMMDRVIATGEATWSENLFLLMLRSGYLEETYFTFSYSPILDESGRPAGIFNACSETTGQVLGQRRMKTLRELTVEARTTADAARSCAEILAGNPRDVPFCLIYLLDSSGTHLRLTGQAGLPAGSAASPPTVTLDPGQDTPWPLAEVAREGRPQVVEKLGERFDCLPREPWDEPAHQAMVLPIAHPGWSGPAGVLVLGISPRRAFDDDYWGFFELVSGQVASALATARAYETERGRADKLAELDRVKTTFFSNVSHEFRTPLTLILGPLEDALRDRTRSLAGPVLEAVHRNALRLLKLVNSLLDFSRVEAGRMRSSFEPTDLPLLTAGLAGAFGSLMDSVGLKLVVDCPPLSEPVYVDPDQWEKIVLNLVSNAFKFTFQGEIAVRLRASEQHVELTVSDTGTGIPADELDRVFERFHRVEGAQGRSHEGTGIGLALVRELVRQHGGSVQVESAVGRGSCFIVTVPRGRDHLPPERVAAASRLARTPNTNPYLLEASQWSERRRGVSQPVDAAAAWPVAALPPEPDGLAGATVLVADDNPDMREYLVRLLSPIWTVEAVEDGQAALEAVRRRPPDLVLSDIMMPRMDGVAMLQGLRADPAGRSIPVLFLSARAGEEALIAGLDTGADDYLSKPFSANELLARVRTNIAVSRQRRQWTTQLEARNAELKQALADAQTAREEAVEASRAKSGFLATMSHEIRTPLNAVIGFAGLLNDQELSPRQREYARAIRDSGDHLLGIINDILDFSKLQSGRFELSPAPFALRPTLESALDFVAGKAAERGVDLAYVMGPEVPAGLEADEARVRQILINYLSNAVKFTTRGEVVLSVQCEPASDGRQTFHFTVRDTGRGIPADRLDLLFTEFTQVDPSVGSQYGGTGLGLAICRKLAGLQGGRVWAESTEGVGSAFHFSLPAVARPDLEPGDAPRRDSLRGLRALIVDDNRTNIDILRAQTESWGMRVRSTENPIEALAWVKRGEEFDLIITDQDMPIMNGIELACSIRRLPAGGKVPLVLFSSIGGGVVSARESNVNFAAILTKPIRQSELFNRISELFGPELNSRAAGKPEAPPPVPPLTVLLVEDNAMNQSVAQILLERIGYHADLASDGAEAIEALTRKSYDVILMDVQMPVLDGLQATRAIRAQGTTVRQPHIIAMTANAMRGDREACLEAGMDDYVSKPIGRTELADALKRAVRPAPSNAPNAEAAPGGPEVSAEGLARLNRDVGAEAAADLVDMFVAAAPRFVVALRTALDSNDAVALASTAHQLKSNCLTLGANQMGRLLQDLEAAGLRGSLQGCAATVGEVERRLWSALSELTTLRRRWQ
jgi:signal transduction histidine kinase/HPt (histidine-containing phosphotransfer) domain-containing protein